MPGNDKSIKDMLQRTADRDEISYGMWRRYMLEPATVYEWRDPRRADGIPVLARRALTPGTINERLHAPYDREIVSNKVSYFASNIQTIFDPALPEAVPAFYKDMQQKAGFDSRLLSQAKFCVDQGTSYLMCWVNTAGSFKTRPIPADHAYVVYNEMTGEPETAYRYYIGKSEKAFCEVYDGIEVSTFKYIEGIWTLQSTEPHGLGTVSRPAVPIIELRNNPERLGNPEMIISLADAFDTSMSDLSSEIAQLRLSYLLIKGMGTDAKGVKEQLQQAGIIVIDDANADARFVDRNMNVQAVQQLQSELRVLIFEGASSYDPTITSEGTSPTAFEMTMRYDMLDKDAIVTIAEWQEGLGYFDYVVRNYMILYEGSREYDVGGIVRVFRKVIPKNMLQALVEAKNAGIMLSNETLLEISGLPVDPVREAGRLNDNNGVVDTAINNNEDSLDEGETQRDE